MPLSGYVIVSSVILLFKENQVAFLYVEDNVLEVELWVSPLMILKHGVTALPWISPNHIPTGDT